MSYTNINHLIEIINKKVLFIDSETTGLVKDKGFNYKQEEKFPNYTENIYDNARIVQIAWLYMKDFDYDYVIEPDNINQKIIKPSNYKILNHNFHGITNEYALANGKDIKKVLKKFSKIIIDTNYIIGYNVYFDINILLHELYKLKYKKTIKKILNLINEKKILCIGEIASIHAKPHSWKKDYKYQIPKQIDVYEALFTKKLKNAHNAQYDVSGMIEIMFNLFEKEFLGYDGLNIYNKILLLEDSKIKNYKNYINFTLKSFKPNYIKEGINILNKSIDNEFKIINTSGQEKNKYIVENYIYFLCVNKSPKSKNRLINEFHKRINEDNAIVITENECHEIEFNLYDSSKNESDYICINIYIYEELEYYELIKNDKDMESKIGRYKRQLDDYQYDTDYFMNALGESTKIVNYVIPSDDYDENGFPIDNNNDYSTCRYDKSTKIIEYYDCFDCYTTSIITSYAKDGDYDDLQGEYFNCGNCNKELNRHGIRHGTRGDDNKIIYDNFRLKILGYNLFNGESEEQIKFIKNKDYDILFLSESSENVINNFENYKGYYIKSHCGYTYLGINKKIKTEEIKLIKMHGIIILHAKINDNEIILGSLHLAPSKQNINTRRKQLTTIMEELNKLNLTNIPIILGGDTNMRHEESTNGLKLTDVYLINLETKYFVTYPNKKFKSDKIKFTPTNDFRYDRFFIRNCQALIFKTIENNNSDHLAIATIIQIKKV